MKLTKKDISAESSWIRSDSEKFETRLTGLDYFLGNVAVRRVIYFGQRLDAQTLRQSLEKVLRFYPTFEGRIKETDGGFSICTATRGVLFTEASIELPMPEVGVSAPSHDQSLFVPDLSAKSIMRGEEPLCKVQLTNFQNGATLGVCTSHIVADGNSIWKFLLDWARYTNQTEVETPPLIGRDEYYELARGDGAQPTAAFPYRKLTLGVKLKMGYELLRGLRQNVSRYIYFDEESLKVVKSLAGGEKLSRFDLLGALLMKLVGNTRKRSKAINFYAVYNLRLMPAMSIPETYVGNALAPGDVEFQVSELRSQSVAEIALRIRNLKDSFTKEAVCENIAFVQRLVRENGLNAVGSIAGLLPVGIYKSFCEGGFIYNVWAFPIYDFIVQGNTPVWYDFFESAPTKALDKVIVLPSPSGGLLVRVTSTKRCMRSLLGQLNVKEFRPDLDRIKEM